MRLGGVAARGVVLGLRAPGDLRDVDRAVVDLEVSCATGACVDGHRVANKENKVWF